MACVSFVFQASAYLGRQKAAEAAARYNRRMRTPPKILATRVVDRSRFLRSGEQELGWAARTGRIPLGYFGDAEATQRTFPEIEGQRVVIPGDRASLEPDGTIRLPVAG